MDSMKKVIEELVGKRNVYVLMYGEQVPVELMIRTYNGDIVYASNRRGAGSGGFHKEPNIWFRVSAVAKIRRGGRDRY